MSGEMEEGAGGFSERLGLESGLAAIDAALSAADAVFRHYAQRPLAVRFKAVDEPVTELDQEVERAIVAVLSSARPEVPVVSEEVESAAMEAEAFFSVDPLDGTARYLAGTDEYVAQIGLVIHGRATLGGILHPASGRRWIGGLGQGVRVRHRDQGDWQALAPQPQSEALRLMVGYRRRGPAFWRLLAALPPHELKVRGSAGAKALALLEGEAELWPSLRKSLKEWDLAAPTALLQAAGGEATDLFGDPLRFRGGRDPMPHGALCIGPTLAASALPRLFASLAEILREPDQA